MTAKYTRAHTESKGKAVNSRDNGKVKPPLGSQRSGHRALLTPPALGVWGTTKTYNSFNSCGYGQLEDALKIQPAQRLMRGYFGFHNP